jgi:hypothetical protein
VRHRSAGDRETGLFDLDEEVAGEAGLDAKSVTDPLPRLGDDILVEPLARGLVQRPDIWKSLMSGISIEAGCLDGLSPAGARPAEIRRFPMNQSLRAATQLAPPQRSARGRAEGGWFRRMG